MEELRELRANYEQKIHDYEELMDIRVQLDQEIATYRALLQEEETRCVCVCVLRLVCSVNGQAEKSRPSSYASPLCQLVIYFCVHNLQWRIHGTSVLKGCL